MKKLWRLVVVLSLSALALAVDQAKESKAADRVQASADVLNEIQSAPDSGVPQEILSRAECVAVVPSMLKGGFIVGAKYGRGVASCRTPKGWSSPAFFLVEGGSFGFQIGGQAVDLVMLIMNNDGMQRLLTSQFTLGMYILLSEPVSIARGSPPSTRPTKTRTIGLSPPATG